MRSRKSYLKNDFKNALEDNDSDMLTEPRTKR